VLTVEVKRQCLACFGHISIKIMLKMIRERSERTKKKKSGCIYIAENRLFEIQ